MLQVLAAVQRSLYRRCENGDTSLGVVNSEYVDSHADYSMTGSNSRKHAGEPVPGGLARWVLVVLHCFGLKAIIAIVTRRIGWSTWLKSAMLSA